jgi:hypothetical protein
LPDAQSMTPRASGTTLPGASALGYNP